MMDIINLNEYIVKIPTNYDYLLFQKCGITIKFPFVLCFPDTMEENIGNCSLWNKSILFISIGKSNTILTNEQFAQIYEAPKFGNYYVKYYNIYGFSCKFNRNNIDVEKFWNLNISDDLKLQIHNKIIKHYYELAFLCKEMIEIDDVKNYIMKILINF